MKKIIISLSCIILAIIGITFTIKYDERKHPVSYEQKIVEIIDKKESSHIAYIGKTMIPITNYTLIANTNEKVSVSSSVYAKTNIGDKIIISCKIRDKKVISISYYEAN